MISHRLTKLGAGRECPVRSARFADHWSTPQITTIHHRTFRSEPVFSKIERHFRQSSKSGKPRLWTGFHTCRECRVPSSSNAWCRWTSPPVLVASGLRFPVRSRWSGPVHDWAYLTITNAGC